MRIKLISILIVIFAVSVFAQSNKKGLEKLLGIRIVGVRSLDEAMDELF